MQYTVMQRAMAAGHRIFEVLDVPVTIADKPGAIDPRRTSHATVELEHVTFGYAPERPILHDVSLKVSPARGRRPGRAHRLGQDLASPPWSIASTTSRRARVLVGGHDVRDVTLESLGAVVGMVLQEPFLFSGTIEENIRYNTARATPRRRHRRGQGGAAPTTSSCACRTATTTQLGQRGRNLSVGQRQLISFARALVADPQILILDEATANIDSFTEQAIQKALQGALRRPHLPGDRPPPGHGARRRPDHRPSRRPHRRAGPARGPDAPTAASTPASTPPATARSTTWRRAGRCRPESRSYALPRT